MVSFTVRFPHRCNGKSLSQDGTHTGAMVLYYGFDEQADMNTCLYKDRYIISASLMIPPSYYRQCNTTQ